MENQNSRSEKNHDDFKALKQCKTFEEAVELCKP
jgi:hypothetical protein